MSLALLPDTNVEELFVAFITFLNLACEAKDLTQVNLAASAALSRLLGIPDEG